MIRRIIQGGLAGAASRTDRPPRMIWKTTTSVGLRHMPDEGEMLNIYSPVGLALFDMKALADIEDLGNPWEVRRDAGNARFACLRMATCFIGICFSWTERHAVIVLAPRHEPPGEITPVSSCCCSSS